MKTIPQIREELLEIANSIINVNTSGKIRRLVRDMHRRPSVRRARVESAEFTPELARRVRAYANEHPAMSYIKIGRRYNISIGRVSEALVGRRAA